MQLIAKVAKLFPRRFQDDSELHNERMVFTPSVVPNLRRLERVDCAAMYGTRMMLGTVDGIYMVDLQAAEEAPVKVLSCKHVKQLDILQGHDILVVLTGKVIQAFPIRSLSANRAVENANRAITLSINATFFKTGVCLGRDLLCVVKSGPASSTIAVLEPILPGGSPDEARLADHKTSHGELKLFRVFKEFRITECNSVHFLKTKLCLGQTANFEVVDLQTLDTQLLLDPADPALAFIRDARNSRPLAIYRIESEYLLCYTEFAFYVNKRGWRARSDWLMKWKGDAEAFAMCFPFVLAFDAQSVEVRHVNTGALVQIISGRSMRLLCSDTASSTSVVVANSPQPLNSNYKLECLDNPLGNSKRIVYTSKGRVYCLTESAEPSAS